MYRDRTVCFVGSIATHQKHETRKNESKRQKQNGKRKVKWKNLERNIMQQEVET
jgi:hypothetical protein